LAPNTGSNTIDAGPPASRVQPLPVAEAISFTVTWVGSDANGSGVAFYDVYVSDNGSPLTLWQAHTLATSATFTGTVGHTYGFASAATDNVSNREAVRAAADVTVPVVGISNILPVLFVADPFGPHPNASADEAFTRGLYRLILGRDAGAAEVAAYV